MQRIRQVISNMIQTTPIELDNLLKNAVVKTYARRELLSQPHLIPNDIFFINRGIIRVTITDKGGTEHTIHFALENQFIADYASFLQRMPSHYRLQALEETEVVILPRAAIEWGYQEMREGEKLGRLIAEFYFVYHDQRIKNMYALTPKERYDAITEVFSDIHNRVPQHMIASYLGITPVHLSRLKRSTLVKV